MGMDKVVEEHRRVRDWLATEFGPDSRSTFSVLGSGGLIFVSETYRPANPFDRTSVFEFKTRARDTWADLNCEMRRFKRRYRRHLFWRKIGWLG